MQVQRDIRAVDAHTCRESFEAAELNIFCPTLTLSHEFINISASMRVQGIIFRCGHRDARLSKIRTRARLGVKGVCAFQTDLSSIFRRSGLRSLSSVLYCLLVVP